MNAQSPTRTRMIQHLQRWCSGDDHALEVLLEAGYAEVFLPRAKQMMGRHRYGHLLAPEDLLHRAYYKVAGISERRYTNLDAFLGLFQKRMRQVLIELVRHEEALVRGGSNKSHIPIDLIFGAGERP